MNKKAIETSTLGVIIGILIAVVLSLIILNLIQSFISGKGTGEEEKTNFYFIKLVEDLINLKENELKDLKFVSSENFIIIAFNKEIEMITRNDFEGTCLNYQCLNCKPSEDIKKPVKCRNKNCLCLCSVETSGGEKLEIDCLQEEVKCIEMPLKINPKPSCRYFIFYDIQEKLYNLNAKREKDSFAINILSSKTL
jgi:hypothetical protein